MPILHNPIFLFVSIIAALWSLQVLFINNKHLEDELEERRQDHLQTQNTIQQLQRENEQLKQSIQQLMEQNKPTKMLELLLEKKGCWPVPDWKRSAESNIYGRSVLFRVETPK